PPFAADLTAFAPYGSHVGGHGRIQGWRRSSRFFRLWRFAGGTVYDPFSQLVRIAWTLAFSYGHGLESLSASKVQTYPCHTCLLDHLRRTDNHQRDFHCPLRLFGSRGTTTMMPR